MEYSHLSHKTLMKCRQRIIEMEAKAEWLFLSYLETLVSFEKSPYLDVVLHRFGRIVQVLSLH